MVKEAALSAALALAIASPAPADEAIRATIPCAVGLLCEVSFSPGEVLGDWFASDAKRWSPATSFSGFGSSTMPRLLLEPTAPGLRANFIAFSKVSNREYELTLVSTNGSTPTYAHLAFHAQPHRAGPKPMATPVPTIAALMNAACRAQTDSYTVDAAPANERPVQVCHDQGHTFVQLPAQATAVTDLPTVFEDGQSGPTSTNFHFYEAQRIFEVDSVADLELRYSAGKHGLTVHVKRVVVPVAASAPVAQVTADPILSSMLEARGGTR
ncbi:MAG: TrbG/VirB9 family P-type conjugative transfer protein [Vulcanimicrobiaceae bacterium]